MSQVSSVMQAFSAQEPSAPSKPAWHSGITALLHPEEGWLTFVLIASLFLVTVFTVEASKWVREMPGLTGLALNALLTGYILARLKVLAVLLHPIALVLGLLAIAWLTISSAAGERFEDQIVDAAVRLYNFWEVAQKGSISTDGLPFVLQVVLLTWVVGYLSAWFLYRSHNVWLALIPPATALLVNLTYLPGRFTGSFFLFVLLGIALVLAVQRAELERRWKLAHVARNEVARAGSVGPVLVSGSVLVVLAFWMPLLGQSLPVTVFWEQATTPWRSFEREFDRLFASLSSGQVAPLHSFGGAMPLRGAVNFGDQFALSGRFGLLRDEILHVGAAEAGFWRAETYATYTGQGWVMLNQLEKSLPQDPVRGAIEEYKERATFVQTIEVVTPLDVLFYRGVPIYGNTAALGKMAHPASFTLDLTDFSKNSGLRPELQDLARSLRANLRSTGRLIDQREIQRFLPTDVRVVRPTLRGTEIQALEVSRTEPFPPDFSSLRPQPMPGRGQKYTITSSVSIAPVETLQMAGNGYPGWVMDQYLQLPDGVTERVRALARAWTQDATNAFDKATIIEGKLREFTYSTSIPPPPRDGDAVDYFLFSSRRGYADYYASAMVVMLRTLGIPARVVVGYVAGEWDTEKEHYVVREAHAHSWTEVFFPAAGWVEFNPSPNWPTLPRRYLTNPSGGAGDEFLDDELLDAGLDEEPPTEGMVGSAAGAGGLPLLVWAAAVLLTAAGVAFFVLRVLWQLGMRSLSLSAQMYEKMCRLAVLAGLGPKVEQTPYEYAHVLGAALPAVKEDVDEIAEGYVRARYGQQELSPGERQRISQAWQSLRGALIFRMIARLKRWGSRRRSSTE